MSEERAVILGAAGFIGSHLVDRFLAEGWSVTGVDNLITGNLDNVAHLRSNTKFELIHHDVSRHIDIPGPVHFIYHMASPASPAG